MSLAMNHCPLVFGANGLWPMLRGRGALVRPVFPALAVSALARGPGVAGGPTGAAPRRPSSPAVASVPALAMSPKVCRRMAGQWPDGVVADGREAQGKAGRPHSAGGEALVTGPIHPIVNGPVQQSCGSPLQ